MLQQVQQLLDAGKLGEVLARRYPEQHDVRSDTALYEYVMELKNRYLRNADPITKVAYDNKLKGDSARLGHAHHGVTRAGRQAQSQARNPGRQPVQTDRARILKMIVVHELAHLKEREHDKAFYQLCQHTEPNYHQYEFDLRLYLTDQDQRGTPSFSST